MAVLEFRMGPIPPLVLVGRVRDRRPGLTNQCSLPNCTHSDWFRGGHSTSADSMSVIHRTFAIGRK